MSGSNSSVPASGAAPEPLSFAVHSMPSQGLDVPARTRRGRWQMLLLLLVCAAPVLASYFTYFVIQPQGSGYSELITPPRPLPDLPFTDAQGRPVAAASLHDQWLLVVVAGGACDAACEQALLVQRQVRETLGREKYRIDKLWLVPDGEPVRDRVAQAMAQGDAETVLHVPRAALAQWLEPAPGQRLEDHLYVVDPMGRWMMRVPPQPEPARLKRDLERLLRASAGWDQPGR